MNFISVIIGIISLILALVGLFPLLGWINWIALACSVIGAAIGIFPSKKTGLNLNLLVLMVAIFRLFIGGGIF